MITLLSTLLVSGLFSFAAEPAGYVVKVDSDIIYLDHLAEAAAGREFVLYKEGEELKHPVTGASLGRIEKEIGRGHIKEVLAQYNIGLLESSPADRSAVKPGLRYKLGAGAPQSAPTPPQAAAPATPQSAAQPHAPIWRSPAVSMEAIDVAAGDILGSGKPSIILADERKVQAYPGDGSEWKPVCSYEDKNTAVKILSIDAKDLNGDGRAEVFATHFNSFFNRVETVVLDCKNGAFEKLATLPWATRAFLDETGSWKLAAQQLMDDRNFPYANIYLLEFKNGKYAQSGKSLNRRRMEWAYGFAVAQDPTLGEPFEIFYTGNDSIRVQYKKGTWVSPEAFGQTANRIRWRENPLMFRPRLITTQEKGGLSGLYTISNNAALGGLASPFGIYSSGELHRLKWTGIGLEADWKTEIAGYAAGVAPIASAAPGQPEDLVVAVVGKNSRTSVWKFAP
ncbi:MAG: VCBS repeat-containing protein [Elusimicrobia bacterium]|nr:VCBS repeat-containing protein [Elusimicrobiota bacterium]